MDPDGQLMKWRQRMGELVRLVKVPHCFIFSFLSRSSFPSIICLIPMSSHYLYTNLCKIIINTNDDDYKCSAVRPADKFVQL